MAVIVAANMGPTHMQYVFMQSLLNISPGCERVLPCCRRHRAIRFDDGPPVVVALCTVGRSEYIDRRSVLQPVHSQPVALDAYVCTRYMD